MREITRRRVPCGWFIGGVSHEGDHRKACPMKRWEGQKVLYIIIREYQLAIIGTNSLFIVQSLNQLTQQHTICSGLSQHALEHCNSSHLSNKPLPPIHHHHTASHVRREGTRHKNCCFSNFSLGTKSLKRNQ